MFFHSRSSVLNYCNIHVLIGFGFLMMIFICREDKKLSSLCNSEHRLLLGAIFLAGVVIVCENGSINAALSEAPVAYVMGLKRLMPVFAFLIGYFYFKEKSDLKKKVIAMVMMIMGAILITAFG